MAMVISLHKRPDMSGNPTQVYVQGCWYDTTSFYGDRTSFHISEIDFLAYGIDRQDRLRPNPLGQAE